MLLHENTVWFIFNLIAVNISCASKKYQKFGGSTFSSACEDDEPLSPEVQQKLRSKYLFDDGEDESVGKRKMIRSQSLIERS